MPRRLLLAFTITGISALTYEIIWVRLLGDLFGHTVYAIQVVLAIFFAGIAAGSFLSDRIDLTRWNALKIYAGIEAVVGLAGVLFPYGVRLLTPFYDQHAPLALGTGSAIIYRLVIAGLLLVIPTALMGATFPLVVRWQRSNSNSGSGVATLYAANTLGGALGAWLSAFVFIRLLGVQNTLVVAALGNLLAAVLAFTLKRPSQRAATEEDVTGGHETVADVTAPTAMSSWPLSMLLFATGFIAISLEVFWSRALDQVLSGSVYSFATVLAVFLLGIALGSWVYRAWLRHTSPLSLFAAVEVVLANYIIISLFLIGWVPDLSEDLLRLVGLGFLRRAIAVESLLSAAIIFVPTLCMGIIFPLLLDLAKSSPHSDRVGLLVGANTLGSVVAPLAAGFFLLPALGLHKGLALIAGVAMLVALAVGAFSPLRRRPLSMIGALVVALLLFFLAPTDIRIWGKPGETLIDFREDPAATVSVVEYGGRAKEKKLKVNNTYSQGGGRGVFTERRQGHLPMLLHPSPDRVLVLGVGTGNTLGAIALHRLRDLVAVELISGVVDLARRNFADSNYRVLEDPAVRVLTADALRAVRAPNGRYDVVIADLFHPWQAGVGSLYSREHFLAARRALAPGGIFCQWLPLYQLSEDDLKIIVRTFLAAFPEVSGWLGNFGSNTPVLALVGSEGPIQLHWKRLEDSLANPALRAGLESVYLDRPAEVFGGYVGGGDELRRFAGAGALNSIDRPMIEFRAPMTLFSETFEPAKLNALEALTHMEWQPPRVPISFADARGVLSEDDIQSNVAAVRWMVQALIESDRGKRGLALEAGIKSCQMARQYDVPASVLAELAWDSYKELPAPAERAFVEALRIKPGDANALTGLGAAYLFQRRADEAVQAFQRALKIRPGWPEALDGLDKAQRLKGR
ncbi:MAG TPA: fused MFS/spermidine synthase [Blastocatellia bacterium]|nr:fused MFS/spermidine synthase [Blastocatellia bacterium]